MRKLICLLILAITLRLNAALADSKTRIGVLAPLSGDVAVWGQDTQRALVLANEMLGNKQRFELIFEDDKCLGKEAAVAAQKLISVDKIQYSMIVCTEPTLSAAPIFERNKVVVVAPGATGAAVSNAGDYIFRTWPSDGELAKTVFEYVYRHYKNPILLTELRGMPQEFARVLLELAAKEKFTMRSENFLSAAPDYRALILKVRKQSPDVLIINTDSERTFLALVNQLAEAHWDIPLIGNYIVGTPAFYEKAGKRAEGIVYGDAPEVRCTSKQRGCEVLDEYLKRYGMPQSSLFMVASTIAAYTVIMDTALSSFDARQYLYSHTFNTLLGPISFDPNGDVQGLRHTLRKIVNGTPAVLD